MITAPLPVHPAKGMVPADRRSYSPFADHPDWILLDKHLMGPTVVGWMASALRGFCPDKEVSKAILTAVTKVAAYSPIKKGDEA